MHDKLLAYNDITLTPSQLVVNSRCYSLMNPGFKRWQLNPLAAKPTPRLLLEK